MKRSDLETLKKMLDGTEFEVLNESPNENNKFFVVRMKPEKTEVKLHSSTLGDKFTFVFDVKNYRKAPLNIGQLLASNLEYYLNLETYDHLQK
jgi:hypothetical protein